MGLFDAFKGKKDTLTKQSGFVAAQLFMMASDGRVDESEFLSLINAIKNAGRNWESHFQTAGSYIQNKTFQNFQEDLAKLGYTREQKLCLVANLLDILMADGRIAEGEKAVFGQVMAALQLSEGDVKQVIETIALKNSLAVLED